MNQKKLINSINQGKTAVFCGAGISYHSGLPLVKDFTEYFFSILGLKSPRINSIVNSGIPFESLAETIIDETNSTKFLDIYKGGKTNSNHQFLARLAKAGKIKLIVTTNFDTLIEQAFKEENLLEKKDYLVYYKEKDFERIPWNSSKILLIKIHGSINSKRDMGVTLKQISSSPLTAERRKVIEYLFSSGRHQAVMILGYSCSDVFDITPQTLSLEKKLKQVCLIDHVPDKKILNASTLFNKDGRNPFIKFRDAKRITVDTDFLVKILWREILSSDYSFKYFSGHWKNPLKNWIREMAVKNPSITNSIVGKIFYNISDYNYALINFNRALKKAKGKYEEAIQYSNIGIVYKELGRNKTSVNYHDQALKLCNRLRKWTKYTACLNNLAYTYRFWGDIEGAFKYQNDSLRMAKKIGNKRLTTINYNNLGILYGHIKDHNAALSNFQEALSLMRTIGLKQWEASTLSNIGIAMKNLDRLPESLQFHNEALAISTDIGSRQQQCQALGNMGQTYFFMKKYGSAITKLKAAAQISHEIHNYVSEYQDLRSLVKVYKAIKKRSSAAYYNRKANQIKRKTDWMKAKTN